MGVKTGQNAMKQGDVGSAVLVCISGASRPFPFPLCVCVWQMRLPARLGWLIKLAVHRILCVLCVSPSPT